jgi:hypothetical protein
VSNQALLQAGWAAIKSFCRLIDSQVLAIYFSFAESRALP